MTSIPSDCLGQYARRADAAFRRMLKAKLLGSPNGWRGARGHRDLQNNCTALIEAHQVERVLADIDADCGDAGGIN